VMQRSLPEKLRILRAERGLTLEGAALETGVTRETLGLLERGKRHPHTPTLTKIARGYGVPVEDLLEPAAPKAPAPPSLESVEETEEERLDFLEDYRQKILAVVEKLDSEFRELQGTGDSEKLSILYTQTIWATLGAIDGIEDEEIMQENADLSEKEEQAKYGVMIALAKLSSLTDNIEDASEGSTEDATVTRLSDYKRKREKVARGA
jgi:transcriptional regulator with XRE-family HTH domain